MHRGARWGCDTVLGGCSLGHQIAVWDGLVSVRDPSHPPIVEVLPERSSKPREGGELAVPNILARSGISQISLSHYLVNSVKENITVVFFPENPQHSLISLAMNRRLARTY